MGLGHWSKVHKVARVLALVATLATACESESELFLKLVQTADKPVATQLLNEPKRKKDLERVKVALGNLNSKIRRLKDMTGPYPAIRSWSAHPDHFNMFLANQMIYLETFNEKPYPSSFSVELGTLRTAGLSKTADSLEKELTGLYLAADKLIAEKINEGVEPPKRLGGIPSSEKTNYRIILSELQILLRRAKLVSFTKTADACSNALITIRGALAK